MIEKILSSPKQSIKAAINFCTIVILANTLFQLQSDKIYEKAYSKKIQVLKNQYISTSLNRAEYDLKSNIQDGFIHINIQKDNINEQIIVPKEEYMKQIKKELFSIVYDEKYRGNLSSDNSKYLSNLANQIAPNTETAVTDIINFVAKYIKYTPDEEISFTNGINDFAKSSLQTLVEKKGDCEDFSILTRDLLTAKGIESFVVTGKENENSSHAVIAVKVSEEYFLKIAEESIIKCKQVEKLINEDNTNSNNLPNLFYTTSHMFIKENGNIYELFEPQATGLNKNYTDFEEIVAITSKQKGVIKNDFDIINIREYTKY